MIVVDLETSGLDYDKCGIWQIGAVDFISGDEFLEESRIDDEDIASEEALKIIGKTDAELRDKKKQSQKKLLENFFKWIENKKVKNLICQGPQFDYAFLETKAYKYGLKPTYPHRAFDLHTLAQLIYYKENKKFLIKENQSDMGLSRIMELIGKKDERIAIKDGKVVKEGKPHNALEDAKIEAECFKKLLERLK